MFDALSNFVIYLHESIENSNDPGEIAHLERLLKKALEVKKTLEGAKAQRLKA